MTEEKKVLVYEGKEEKEVESIRKKLVIAGIEADFEDSPMAFPYPKEKNSLKLKVDIMDEAKAFEIIDRYVRN